MIDASAAPVTEFDACIARRRRILAASLVITTLTTLVTGLAHAVGGGSAPNALLLAAAAVVTLLVLTPVLRNRRSVARQLVAVTIAQALQHVLYALPETVSGSAASHVHGAAAALPPATVHAHASMPLAHVAAGFLTMALLRWVPRAVAAMHEAMSLRLAAAVLTWVPANPRRPAAVVAAHRPRRTALDALGCACGTRGPPALLV